jgi:aminoglycoside phosphotransferase (APT) family kinase protein
VSGALVAEHRALVERVFPALAVASFEPIGDGWTVFTYEVNDDTIVQLARSAYAAERLRAQMRMLPELARELPAAVPVPTLLSEEPVVMGYRKLEGAPPGATSDGAWPERLGRFLYDLHVVAPEILGLRWMSAATVSDVFDEELASLRERVLPLLDPATAQRLGARMDAFVTDDATRRYAPCLTHGDIGPEHILVSPEGDLVGVLDWEELAIGDPAADLAWMLHARPADGERVLAAYGGAPDASFRERAAFRFVLMPFHDVVHGLDTGDEALIEDGLAGIRDRDAETA